MNTKNINHTDAKNLVIRLRVTESEAQMFKSKAEQYGCKTISGFIRLRCLIQDDPEVLREENERNDI